MDGVAVAVGLGDRTRRRSIIGVLRTVPNRWLSGFATAWVELFRNIPLLVQLFIWYFVLPELLPQGLGNAIKQSNPLWQQFFAAVLCLGLSPRRVSPSRCAPVSNRCPRGRRTPVWRWASRWRRSIATC